MASAKIPVLGGTGLGAGLENLGSGLVHVVARVGDQAGGNAQQAQRQLDLGLGKLNAKRIEQLGQRVSGGKRGGLGGIIARLLQILVALGDKRKDSAHGTGGVKIVVHALLKGGAGLCGLGGKHLGCCLIGIGRRMVRSPAQVLDRTGNTRERIFGTLQALPGEVERRAIARLQHQQAQSCGRVLLEDLGQRKEVAERLGHLLAVNQQHARVHPGVGETLVPGAGGLGDSFS